MFKDGWLGSAAQGCRTALPPSLDASLACNRRPNCCLPPSCLQTATRAALLCALQMKATRVRACTAMAAALPFSRRCTTATASLPFSCSFCR